MNLRSFIPALIVLVHTTVFAAVDDTPPLETAMKHMSSAYKALSFDLRRPSDANKGLYLSIAGKLKTEAQTSRGLVPQKVGTLPADQRGAMVKAYQKSIDGLIQWIDSLTQDIQNSRWDDARKAMASIKQKMIHGHKDFRTDD